MKKLLILIPIFLNRHIDLLAQTRVNKVGVAIYNPTCTGAYLVRQDTFKIIGPKIFKLPPDTNDNHPIVIGTRCVMASLNINPPLLVINGVVCEYNKLNELDANDILSIAILKGGTCLSICKSVETNGVIIITTKTPQSRTIVIRDLINGQPIPNATILLASRRSSDKSQVLVAIDSGIVQIKRNYYSNSYDLIVSAVGYKNFSATLRNKYPDIQNEIFLERDYQTCQEVVVSSQIFWRGIHCSMQCMSLTNNFIGNKPSINKTEVRLYPNPIRSNSTLTIELNQKQYGDHLLQLFNQSGQLILSKDIYIDEKARLFTMNMPSIISGNYFLKLTSKATGRSYTEKLIVN